MHVQVHESALKRGLTGDHVIRMWNAGTDETVIDDDEPPRYMRLAFDDSGRPWEFRCAEFREFREISRDPCEAGPEVHHRSDAKEETLNDGIARPVNGSYGTIDGVEITEEVIARLVKNAEDGFPGSTFRSSGRPARTEESTRAITVRLSESELAAVMARAERENRSRSDAIRAALAEWAQAS